MKEFLLHPLFSGWHNAPAGATHTGYVLFVLVCAAAFIVLFAKPSLIERLSFRQIASIAIFVCLLILLIAFATDPARPHYNFGDVPSFKFGFYAFDQGGRWIGWKMIPGNAAGFLGAIYFPVMCWILGREVKS